MLIITWNEIETLRLYEVEDKIYNRIKSNFAHAINERIANRILEKYLEQSLKTLLNCSGVDLLEGIAII